MACGRIQQLVLHFGKKLCRLALASLIVGAKRKEIANFLVEAFFRGAYVPDALQKLIEEVTKKEEKWTKDQDELLMKLTQQYKFENIKVVLSRKLKYSKTYC